MARPVSGEHTGAERSTVDDVPLRPRLKREWELLSLEDGSLVFNSILGKNIRLARPPPEIRALLERLDGKRTVPELLESFSRSPTERELASLQQALRKLYTAGIIEDGHLVPRPEWVDDALYERFRLQLDFFSHYATTRANEYDYFKRLRDAHVAIIGVGGAGSHCAMHLAAAGLGRLTLIDGDVVETSNLVRQVYYRQADVGHVAKVRALERELLAFTRYTRVEVVESFVEGPEHALRLLEGKGIDFVLLCADAPRMVLNRWINQACVSLRLPYINAFAGVAGPIYLPGESPCFGCVEGLFRSRANGYWDLMVKALQHQRSRQYPSFVTGPIPSALVQFMECVGQLTQAWPLVSRDKLVHTSALGVDGEERLERDPSCEVCGPAALRRTGEAR